MPTSRQGVTGCTLVFQTKGSEFESRCRLHAVVTERPGTGLQSRERGFKSRQPLSTGVAQRVERRIPNPRGGGSSPSIRANGMWRNLRSAPGLGPGGCTFESCRPDQTSVAQRKSACLTSRMSGVQLSPGVLVNSIARKGSSAVRRAHNPEAAGSNPARATNRRHSRDGNEGERR